MRIDSAQKLLDHGRELKFRGGESRRYRHLPDVQSRDREAETANTIHCFAFVGGLRIFVYLKLMRSKPFPVRLVPMLSLSDLSGRCGASTSIGPYFGTNAISSGSSRTTRPITTNTGVTAGWPELRRLNAAAYPHHQSQNLSHIPGGNIAKAYFRPQLPPELEFDTDRVDDEATSHRRLEE